MASRLVEVSGSVARPGAAVWDVLAGFDLAWHPGVAACQVEGAARVFTDLEGAEYREERTYLNAADRVLRYRLTTGIAGCTAYNAEVSVGDAEAGCAVVWRAQIEAEAARIDAIVGGTRAIFEAAIGALDIGPNKLVLPSEPGLSYLAGPMRGETLVLFLHGIGGNAENWRAQLERFGHRFPVAAWNMRGYGGSGLGDGQSTVQDHVGDILALRDAMGARRLVLVGLSMGAWIATSFAMRHPKALAGLVLAGGCTGMSEAPEEVRLGFLQSREGPLDQGLTPADFAADVLQVIAGPHALTEAKEALHASMAAIPAESYRDALRCFCAPSERFDFARIACPVMMVTGEHDRLAPPAEIHSVSERIYEAQAAPDVEFHVLEGAGHVCNLEAPEAFNALLEPFLRRVLA